jgi:osmotically-inducible protein OsmY
MKTRSLLALTPRRVAILGTALAAGVLVGCNRPDDSKTAGQKVDAAAAEVKREAELVKESAGNAMTEASRATTAATQAAVRAVEDIGITAGIKAKFAADADLKSGDISVETTAGRAVLRGTAPDAAAQSRAKELAASVGGVTGVDNQLGVLR